MMDVLMDVFVSFSLSRVAFSGILCRTSITTLRHSSHSQNRRRKSFPDINPTAAGANSFCRTTWNAILSYGNSRLQNRRRRRRRKVYGKHNCCDKWLLLSFFDCFVLKIKFLPVFVNDVIENRLWHVMTGSAVSCHERTKKSFKD